MPDDKVLLSVEIDPEAIEDQLNALESRQPGSRGATGGGGRGGAAPPRREDPAQRIDELHKTIKRLLVATVFQTQLQIRSGSIVQTALATSADMLNKIAAASVGGGHLIAGLTAKLTAMGTSAFSGAADLGKGFMQQAARFNPAVIGAMVRRNIAELQSEIAISRRVGPQATESLNAERRLLQDENRIKAQAALRGVAIDAAGAISNLERKAYGATDTVEALARDGIAKLGAATEVLKEHFLQAGAAVVSFIGSMKFPTVPLTAVSAAAAAPTFLQNFAEQQQLARSRQAATPIPQHPIIYDLPAPGRKLTLGSPIGVEVTTSEIKHATKVAQFAVAETLKFFWDNFKKGAKEHWNAATPPFNPREREATPVPDEWEEEWKAERSGRNPDEPPDFEEFNRTGRAFYLP